MILQRSDVSLPNVLRCLEQRDDFWFLLLSAKFSISPDSALRPGSSTNYELDKKFNVSDIECVHVIQSLI